MKWILFLNFFLLYFSMICEDVIRPKKKEDCFKRTFVGEFNKDNSYCCFLNLVKQDESISKCSIHFKKEIDEDKVYETIHFLKNVNTQFDGEDVEIRFFDCKFNYLKVNYLIELLLIFIIFEIL